MANANDTDTLGLVSALQTFDDGETAAKTLAHAVEARLREGIARRGRASLVASGGSTPKRLYEHLSHAELDWSKVAIVLADERWVDPGLTGSNETFLKTHLVQNNAKAASFIGLKTAAANPQAGLEEIEARLGEAPFPFDAVILGMGTDGHTLSWFPDAEGLDTALVRDGARAAAVTATQSDVTGPFVQRATLTRAALSDAKMCALLINGEAKRSTWAAAAGPGRIEAMPVRALMRDGDVEMQTYWWP